jgi:L-iditol 2-dehydrogenase
MWAYRTTGPLTFERISAPRPTPDDLVAGDVIVRPSVGGICGSDLPEARGLMPTRTPASGLGPLHELVGEVVHSTGDRVQVGDRVVGWVKDQHGLSEYVVAAERQLLTVPEEFSDIDAIVAQPLACVLCAVDRLDEVSGQRAVVLGQGPTGLLFDQVLVHRGAAVTGVDPVDRSALAAAMGAGFVHGSSRGWAHHMVGDQRPELVVEAVGHQAATLDHALHGVAPGGQVYLFGVNDDPYYALNVHHLLRKNLVLRAGITVNHAHWLAEAFTHLREYPALARSLVTHTFEIERLTEAYRTAADIQPDRGKVLITMPPSP